MAKAAVSEDEFVEIFDRLRSTTAVAELLGQNVRSVQARKSHIEGKRKIKLAIERRITPQTTVRHNAAVIDYTIDDGIVIIGSDAHIWPGPLTTVQRAFIEMCKRLKPAAVIANGDFADLPGASRWPSLSWNDLRRKPTIKDEISAVQDYLGAVVAATPGAEHLWPAGNHDLRFAALLTQLVPQYEGVPGLELKDHFPQWRSCWRVDINGSVIVRHRELGGEHADYRNTQTQGVTLVTGHDHRIGVTPFRGYRGVTYGVRCGHMCDGSDDPQFVEYLESKAPNWNPGFVVLTFRNGELLYPELVTKHRDNVVCWRGELIDV